MRKILLISLAMLFGLIASKTPTTYKEATAAVTTAEAAAKTAKEAYDAEAKIEEAKKKDKKDKAVADAEKALADHTKTGVKKDATDADKKKFADETKSLTDTLGKAVDTVSKKTTWADYTKAETAVTDAKKVLEAFCDDSKLDFPLFTEKTCNKTATGDAQKLPKGFTDALKDTTKACVEDTTVKGTKSIKVTCKMVDKKAEVTVESFSEAKCKTPLAKDASVTWKEGVCHENGLTPTTWVKVGAPAAAAKKEEGGGVGMYIIIVVVVVVACAALYFLKTKFMDKKNE